MICVHQWCYLFTDMSHRFEKYNMRFFFFLKRMHILFYEIDFVQFDTRLVFLIIFIRIYSEMWLTIDYKSAILLNIWRIFIRQSLFCVYETIRHNIVVRVVSAWIGKQLQGCKKRYLKIPNHIDLNITLEWVR